MPISSARIIPSLCKGTSPPSCVVIATNTLAWDIHGTHTYFISIKVENVAGLTSVLASKPYIHVVAAPSGGVVMEIPISGQEKQSGQLKVRYIMHI